MVVKRTINVGFHSNFGTFMQSGHSLEGFTMGFLSPSLFGRLISVEGFSIALVIHSLDPTTSQKPPIGLMVRTTARSFRVPVTVRSQD